MSIIVPTSRKHDSPSLTGVPGSTSLHLAWHLWYNTGGSMYDHSIVHRKSSGFDNWPSQYTELYGDKFKPSITAVSSGADIIFQYFSGGIGKMHYNGSSWGSATYVSAPGQYPSVSSGNTQAKYVWNSAGTAPYTININSTPLSKEGDGEPYYERRISWLDSTGAHVTVRVKGLSLKTSKGEVQALTLQTVVDEAHAQGMRIGLLRPITLWPFPKAPIQRLADSAKLFFVSELSNGQMVDDVRLALEVKRPVKFYGRMGGSVPTTQEILEQIYSFKE